MTKVFSESSSNAREPNLNQSGSNRNDNSRPATTDEAIVQNSTNTTARFRVIDSVRYQSIRRSDRSRLFWLKNFVSRPTTIFTRFASAIFVKDIDRRGLPLLLGVTLLYLCIEFAYSAWLLVVLAANSTAENIHPIETLGRLISGFAVALLVWPFILKLKDGAITTTLWLLLATSVTVFIVAKLEAHLINWLVSSSSPENRAAAVKGGLIRVGLLNNVIGKDSLGGIWSDETAESVAGKAFMGVVVFLSANSESAVRETERLKAAIVSSGIANKVGGLDGEFDRFVQSQEIMHQRYREYKEGTDRMNRELSDEKANWVWDQYLNSLESKDRSWGRKYTGGNGELVPRYARKKVIDSVRLKGIPVKNNWKTGDKAGFISAYRDRVRLDTSAKLNGLSVDLTEKDFYREPRIQDEWKQKLKYPRNTIVLPVSPISKAEFDKKIFQPILMQRTAESIKAYEGNTLDYADGGSYEINGKSAYEGMIAPVFALILSVTGAIVHVLKSGLLATQLLTARRFKHTIIKVMAITFLTIAVLFTVSKSIETKLTSHPTYNSWIELESGRSVGQSSHISNRLIMYTVDAMIKLQTIAYPVFNFFRIYVELVTGDISEIVK